MTKYDSGITGFGYDAKSEDLKRELLDYFGEDQIDCGHLHNHMLRVLLIVHEEEMPDTDMPIIELSPEGKKGIDLFGLEHISPNRLQDCAKEDEGWWIQKPIALPNPEMSWRGDSNKVVAKYEDGKGIGPLSSVADILKAVHEEFPTLALPAS